MEHELKISRNGVITYRGCKIYVGVSGQSIIYYTHDFSRVYNVSLSELLTKIDEEMFE